MMIQSSRIKQPVQFIKSQGHILLLKTDITPVKAKEEG